MPLYEFRCTKCDVEFEELVMSSKPEALTKVVCPECGSRKVAKRISTFASSVQGVSMSTSAGNCAPSGGG